LRGALSGQIPFQDVLGIVQQTARAQAQEVQQEVGQAMRAQRPEGMMRLGGPQEETQVAEALPTGKAPVAPMEQPVEPTLADALPMLPRIPGQSNRVADLEASGYRPITDPAEARKVSGAIGSKTAAFNTVMDRAQRLIGLTQGRPEVLGPVGTVASFIEQVRAGAQGIARLITGASGEQIDFESYLSDPSTEGMVNKAARQLMRHGAGAAGIDAARAKSLVQEMAYAVARQNETGSDEAGGRGLSVRDFESALAQIGASQSPEQLRAVLTDIVDRQYARLEETGKGLVGQGFIYPLHKMSDADIMKLVQDPNDPTKLNPLVPTALIQRIKEYRQGRQQQQQQQEPQQGQRQGRMSPEEEAQQQRRQLVERERELKAREGRQEARAEAHLQLGREARDQAAEQFAYRKQQDAKAEQEKKMQAIQKAFQDLGKMIAAAGAGNVRVGGGGGGGGGDQNPAAFVIPQRPKRQPPNVPQVQRRQ
jgi:hypothetical protein